MPLSFPLDRDTFLGDARITEQTFYLTENVEFSGLADGSIIRDDLGPLLPTGSEGAGERLAGGGRARCLRLRQRCVRVALPAGGCTAAAHRADRSGVAVRPYSVSFWTTAPLSLHLPMTRSAVRPTTSGSKGNAKRRWPASVNSRIARHCS